ncbi:proline-rich protein 15-like protein [Hemiscyllium ocellatum]|uniref:proline-rich protein 15-like protein n=1 Tax=Hemiscyllium ocellatum TaxID=170820 RepID=UPI0029662811|nr:proline-rich protein 15-like protein [Hemiscyllium ocellatum]
MGESASPSWWKLTFLRKKKNSAKVVYEVPGEKSSPDSKEGGGGPENGEDTELEARLEKIVDKSTKGRHVRVSNSGRFKEKKKVRTSLSESPGFYNDSGNGEGAQS